MLNEIGSKCVCVCKFVLRLPIGDAKPKEKYFFFFLIVYNIFKYILYFLLVNHVIIDCIFKKNCMSCSL